MNIVCVRLNNKLAKKKEIEELKRFSIEIDAEVSTFY
jgi:hypothetical protein